MRGRLYVLMGVVTALLLTTQPGPARADTPASPVPEVVAPAPAAPAVSAAEPPPAGSTPIRAPRKPPVFDPKLPLATLLQLAGAAFAESRFDDSIAYLNAAYARQPVPGLLFNIAQAHRKAAHTQKALELYERFLRESPQSPLAPEAAAHSEAMRARLAAEQATVAKAEAEQLARERSEQAEQAAKLHEAERLQADAALRKELARKEQPVYKRKWFWGLLGSLVGTGIVAGVVVGLALRPPAEPVGSLSTQDVRF